MKPVFEEIQPSFGSSFTVRQFTERDCSGLPYWHVHPECEIVHVSNGRGKRRIGDHISHYEDGDLIFLGPNLPHLGFAQELWEPHVETVLQMREDFLGKGFLERPEMAEVRQLFERAKSGVVFHGQVKWEAGQRVQNLPRLDHFDRLLELLKVLQILARSQEFTTLNISRPALEVKPQEALRMKAVYEFVEENYRRQLTLAEVAAQASMTVPAFCRFFRKLTHKTFIEFLNEFRITQACRLLAQEHSGISAVSWECGFSNLSHFNKQFKNITGANPTAYRRSLRRMVSGGVDELMG